MLQTIILRYFHIATITALAKNKAATLLLSFKPLCHVWVHVIRI